MFPRRAITITAAAALVAFAPASAHAETIASETASGDYAVAVAAGDVDNPRTIRVKVTASRRQKVSVHWTMVCTRGTGAGSKSGSFSGKTTLTRKLRKPYGRPDNCTVSASAQLSRGGRLRVSILA